MLLLTNVLANGYLFRFFFLFRQMNKDSVNYCFIRSYILVNEILPKYQRNCIHKYFPFVCADVFIHNLIESESSIKYICSVLIHRHIYVLYICMHYIYNVYIYIVFSSIG